MRGLRWGAAIVCALVLAFVWLVHDLDNPWVKRRVQALALRELGLAIDYGTVRVNILSGATIEDLVVLSPEEVRSAVPELARVSHVAVRWAWRRSTPIEQLTLDDVAVTVAVDENHRSSLDMIPSSKPATPLSHRAESLFGAPMPVAHLEVSRGSLAVVAVRHGAEVDRITVSGIHLGASADEAGGGANVLASAGDRASPLDLRLARREGAPTAHVRLSAAVRATRKEIALAVDAEITDQTFVAGARVGDPLHVWGRARFDPPTKTTHVAIAGAIADGAYTHASLSVPDEGPVLLQEAEGDIDAARVLSNAPPGVLPVRAARARLRCHVARMTLEMPPLLEAGGVADVDGDLADLHASFGEQSIDVGSANVSARTWSDTPSSTRFHARVHADRADTDGFALDVGMAAVDGRRDKDGAFDVASSGEISRLDVHGPPFHTIAQAVTFRVHAASSGRAPYAGDAEVSSGHLEVAVSGRQLADGAARLQGQLDAFVPGATAFTESTGTLHTSLQVGDVAARLAVSKAEPDALDYDLDMRIPRAALASKGRLERISAQRPVLRQHATLDLDHPAVASLAARSARVTLDSMGDLVRQAARVDVRAEALTVRGEAPSDDRLRASVRVDREAPSVSIELETEGRAKAKLAVTGSFDRVTRGLHYTVDAEASQLGPLRPLLSGSVAKGLELDGLEVGVMAKGELVGLLADVRDGVPTLAAHPWRTVAVIGTSDVRVGHLRLARGDRALSAPSAEWHVDLDASSSEAGVARSFEGRLVVPAVRIAVGPHVLDAGQVVDDVSGRVTGDLANPDSVLEQHASVQEVSQDILPAYPIGNATLELDAHRSRAGVVRLHRFRFVNVKGGTYATALGNVDISDMRRNLAFYGRVEQDLARVAGDPSTFAGKGRATVDWRIESADLTAFEVHADVKAAGVDLRFPRARVGIDSADGEIPVALTFLSDGEGGFTMLRDGHPSPYTSLRFADQHPLLRQRSFVAIRSITTPVVTIAPFVANVQVTRNVVSMEQFEMGMLRGRVAGACALEWAGWDSTLDLRVRAADIVPSHGQPFDGNAQVTIEAKERTLAGRAELLRLSKRQLLDLFDLADPLHQNAAVNRVRSALFWGYPKRARLVFKDGFASMHVELGGLASLASVGDIRGLPMGLLIDRLLFPLTRRRR